MNSVQQKGKHSSSSFFFNNISADYISVSVPFQKRFTVHNMLEYSLAFGVQACGHRYVKIILSGREEQRRMVGKCYVRSNDLTFDPNDDWQTYSYEVCNPNFDIALEGMCSMGISGGMTDTDVYIGATGSYLWQGGHRGVNAKKSVLCCLVSK